MVEVVLEARPAHREEHHDRGHEGGPRFPEAHDHDEDDHRRRQPDPAIKRKERLSADPEKLFPVLRVARDIVSLVERHIDAVLPHRHGLRVLGHLEESKELPVLVEDVDPPVMLVRRVKVAVHVARKAFRPVHFAGRRAALSHDADELRFIARQIELRQVMASDQDKPPRGDRNHAVPPRDVVWMILAVDVPLHRVEVKERAPPAVDHHKAPRVLVPDVERPLRIDGEPLVVLKAPFGDFVRKVMRLVPTANRVSEGETQGDDDSENDQESNFSAAGFHEEGPIIAIGSLTAKVVPAFSRDENEIVPPCDSTIHFAMASPRPLPPASRERALSTR